VFNQSQRGGHFALYVGARRTEHLRVFVDACEPTPKRYEPMRRHNFTMMLPETPSEPTTAHQEASGDVSTLPIGHNILEDQTDALSRYIVTLCKPARAVPLSDRFDFESCVLPQCNNEQSNRRKDDDVERHEEGERAKVASIITGRATMFALVIAAFACLIRASVHHWHKLSPPGATSISGASKQQHANMPQQKPRFTQAWSTGHTGTRFLTDLFGHAWVNEDAQSVGKKRRLNKGTVFYHEYDMLLVNPFAYNHSIREFQQYVLGDGEKGRPFQRGRPKYGKDLKLWNRRGDYDEIREYIASDRAPAIGQVFDHFEPDLHHMVKFGHTAVFLDLPAYYEEMSRFFRFDLVRIVRRRVFVAKSFAEHLHGRRKDPCDYMDTKRGIITCPWFETSLLKPDPSVWDGWTLFQKHLWFADEVEARWQHFLFVHPEADVHVISFSSDNVLDVDAIDDLASFLDVPSPSKNVDQTKVVSHLTVGAEYDMSASQMEAEAEAYSFVAPWCLQNSLPSDYALDCNYMA